MRPADIVRHLEEAGALLVLAAGGVLEGGDDGTAEVSSAAAGQGKGSLLHTRAQGNLPTGRDSVTHPLRGYRCDSKLMSTMLLRLYNTSE